MSDKMNWSPFLSEENNKQNFKWEHSCGRATSVRGRVQTPFVISVNLQIVSASTETDFSQHLATDCVSIDCLSSDFASLLTFGICHSHLTDKIKLRKIHIHGHLTQLCLFGSSSWVQIKENHCLSIRLCKTGFHAQLTNWSFSAIVDVFSFILHYAHICTHAFSLYNPEMLPEQSALNYHIYFCPFSVFSADQKAVNLGLPRFVFHW